MDNRKHTDSRGYYDRDRERGYERDSRDNRRRADQRRNYKDYERDRDDRASEPQSRYRINESTHSRSERSRFDRSKSPERRQETRRSEFKVSNEMKHENTEKKKDEKTEKKDEHTKKKDEKTEKKDDKVVEESVNEFETAEDAQLAAFLGITGFTSTKGRHVKGNEHSGGVDTTAKKRREYRQYLFVKGSYDIPLTKDQLEAKQKE